MKGPCNIHRRTCTCWHTNTSATPETKKQKQFLSLPGGMTFLRIRLCSLYSNCVFVRVCVCVCFGVAWDTVICLHCKDYHPMCQDATQCMGETLVLIYQHMVLIDNPSARGAVGNERDWESKRERKIRRWLSWGMARNREDELACGHPQEAGYGSFFFSPSFLTPGQLGCWSSYKARLSFSASLKKLGSSFIFFEVLCS